MQSRMQRVHRIGQLADEITGEFPFLSSFAQVLNHFLSQDARDTVDLRGGSDPEEGCSEGQNRDAARRGREAIDG